MSHRPGWEKDLPEVTGCDFLTPRAGPGPARTQSSGLLLLARMAQPGASGPALVLAEGRGTEAQRGCPRAWPSPAWTRAGGPAVLSSGARWPACPGTAAWLRVCSHLEVSLI